MLYVDAARIASQSQLSLAETMTTTVEVFTALGLVVEGKRTGTMHLFFTSMWCRLAKGISN